MILIVLALLCLASVPLTGGNLGRLASIRVRGTWVPVVALAIQVLITTVIRGGHEELHKAVHIATYVLIGVFLWSNRRLPGVKIIGLGAFLNALVITVNGGQMAASRTAERLAGHPDRVIPGHDPQVLERYPAPSRELEGIVARLDVALNEVAR